VRGKAGGVNSAFIGGSPHPTFSHLLPSAEKELFCGTFSRRRCLRTATSGQHRANFRYAFSVAEARPAISFASIREIRVKNIFLHGGLAGLDAHFPVF
jgi:hypothetical protein